MRLPAAFALALAACDGGGGGLETGLPENEPLADLDESEAGDLCEAAVDYIIDRVTREGICAVVGLLAGAFGASCEQERAECLAEYRASSQEDRAEEVAECAAEAAAIPPGCDATVADFEWCVELAVRILNQVLGPLSCDDLADDFAILDALERAHIDRAELDECDRLEDECEVPTDPE